MRFILLQGSNETPWVVTAADKAKYDAMFKTADKDNDNLVTGILQLTCRGLAGSRRSRSQVQFSKKQEIEFLRHLGDLTASKGPCALNPGFFLGFFFFIKLFDMLAIYITIVTTSSLQSL